VARPEADRRGIHRPRTRQGRRACALRHRQPRAGRPATDQRRDRRSGASRSGRRLGRDADRRRVVGAVSGGRARGEGPVARAAGRRESLARRDRQTASGAVGQAVRVARARRVRRGRADAAGDAAGDRRTEGRGLRQARRRVSRYVGSDQRAARCRRVRDRPARGDGEVADRCGETDDHGAGARVAPHLRDDAGRADRGRSGRRTLRRARSLAGQSNAQDGRSTDAGCDFGGCRGHDRLHRHRGGDRRQGGHRRRHGSHHRGRRAAVCARGHLPDRQADRVRRARPGERGGSRAEATRRAGRRR
jgi:hypothetical protein